jgi:hypothetical protein
VTEGNGLEKLRHRDLGGQKKPLSWSMMPLAKLIFTSGAFFAPGAALAFGCTAR